MKRYQLDAKGLACPLPVVKTKQLLSEYDVVETTVDNIVATQNLEKLANQLNYNIETKTLSDDEYIVTISKNEKESHTIVDTLLDSCVVPVTQARRILEKEKKVEVIVKETFNVEKLKEFAQKLGYVFTSKEKDDAFSVVIERDEVQGENTPKVAVEKDDSYIVVINKKIMGHGSEELGHSLIKAYLYALGEQEVLPTKIIFYNDGSLLVDKNRSHVVEELQILDEKGVEIVCCGACIDHNNIELVVGNPTNMYFIVEDMRKANKIIRP